MSEQTIVTLRDVARAAKVHPGTASRAINPATRSQVKVATAERVLAAAAELGYRVNPIARSLRTNRSLTVGVLIPDLTNPFYPPIVRGVEDELSVASYVALVANTDNDAAKETRVLETLRERQVDGLIVMTAKRKHPSLVELAATGMPMVLVSRDVDGLKVSGVMLDDEEAIEMAVDALYGLGHRRIAHVAGPRTVSTAVSRRQAFLRATKRASGVSATVLESAQFSIEAGRIACGRLLEEHPDITGIVAANDMIALGCLSALAESGRSCPGDVSVIGVNDSQFLDHTAPPLSTVSVPKYEMGRSAAQLLLSQIQASGGRPAAEVRQMKPDLKLRGSTGPAPG
ncbi:MAG: LacI family DNA-binding transcriptional regulator [Nocardioides sp.]|uniref:LacI family DNA-binding transcriptional regulator n=1 Tax=Nocardioides sp. TaxID=35761 RepID=UPI0039E5E7EA